MYGIGGEEDLVAGSQSRRLRVTGRLRRGITPQQVEGSLAIEPFETRVAGRVDTVRAQLQAQATPTRITLTGIALPLAGVCRVWSRARGGVRQCIERHARTRECPPPRDRHPALDRCEPGPSRPPARHRGSPHRHAGRACWVGARRRPPAPGRIRISRAMLPPTVAAMVRLVPLDFDYRVFLFAFAVAAAATVLFALLPALQATRLTLTDALRGQVSGGVQSSTLRRILVTSQVAVSLLLLIVATTLVRNGTAIQATNSRARDRGRDLGPPAPGRSHARGTHAVRAGDGPAVRPARRRQPEPALRRDDENPAAPALGTGGRVVRVRIA